MPLIDAARLLCLNQKITGTNNTFWFRIGSFKSRKTLRFRTCSEAFSVLQKFRTEEFRK
jgi:CBS domain-containing protein